MTGRWTYAEHRTDASRPTARRFGAPKPLRRRAEEAEKLSTGVSTVALEHAVPKLRCGRECRRSTRSATSPFTAASCSRAKTRRGSFPRGDIELGFCTSCGFISNMAFDPERPGLLAALRRPAVLLADIQRVCEGPRGTPRRKVRSPREGPGGSRLRKRRFSRADVRAGRTTEGSESIPRAKKTESRARPRTG